MPQPPSVPTAALLARQAKPTPPAAPGQHARRAPLPPSAALRHAAANGVGQGGLPLQRTPSTLQAKAVAVAQSLTHARTIQRASSEGRFHKQVGLPKGEADSGGVSAMVTKFANWQNISELAVAMSSTPRVKRHNTSAWITGRINPAAYTRVFLEIAKIRSQHSLDGKAIANTAKRCLAIEKWLIENPRQSRLTVEQLNVLAGSSGAIKVGCNAGRFITLDGVGRLEALRTAISNTGNAALRYVEVFAVTLTGDEYKQLKTTSDYFRDDHGKQRTAPVHDLWSYTAIPRLFVGTALNIFKNTLVPRIPCLKPGEIDRRVPITKETDPED